MSPGNKYHEGNNPHLGEFINHIQGAISNSVNARTNMKNKTQMLFDKMRESRATYLSHLLEGEKDGVCKGIGRRLENKYKSNFEFMVKDPKQVQRELRERQTRERLAREEKDRKAREPKKSVNIERVDSAGEDEENYIGEFSVNTNMKKQREMLSNLVTPPYDENK